jgi:hypothetical protein
MYATISLAFFAQISHLLLDTIKIPLDSFACLCDAESDLKIKNQSRGILID